MRTFLTAFLAIFISIATNAQCVPGCCTPEEWAICAPLCTLAADAPGSLDAITPAMNEASAELSAIVAGGSAMPGICPTRPGCVCPGGKAAPARDAQTVQDVAPTHAQQAAVMRN